MTPDPAADPQTLLDQGRAADAMAACRTRLAVRPEDVRARYFLGVAALMQGDLSTARVALRRALRAAPDMAEAHHQLALVHLREGHAAEAEAAFVAALAADSGIAEAHCDLGNLLRARGDFAGAVESYRRALEILPGRGEIYANLGVSLQESGDLDGALEAYDRAVELAPENAEIRRNRAMGLLAAGRLREGWVENAWRWKTRHFAGIAKDGDIPFWDGSDPAGKTVRVVAEQGFGDSLQFVRYAPLLAERGARVVVRCPTALDALMRSVPGVSAVNDALADCQVHMLDLPRLFDTRLESIPAPIPYFSADPEQARAWAARLGPAKGKRIGLVWRGNPTFKRDRMRSPGLAPLLPLLDMEGVEWLSLQRESAADDLACYGVSDVPELGSGLVDFADTAALLANLDALVTSDTAIAHLAGGMGMPVFLLLGFVADWRWLTMREDSPWYPTMQLYRQSAPSDWADPVTRLRATLSRRMM